MNSVSLLFVINFQLNKCVLIFCAACGIILQNINDKGEIVFDLFLALFGGAYYATKISTDKAQKRNAEFERENKTRSYNEITSDYFAIKRDVETKYITALCNHNTRSQTLETISGELLQVYGTDWENAFKKFNLPDPNVSRTQRAKKTASRECELLLHRPGNPWWAALTILIAKNECRVLDCFGFGTTSHPFGTLEFVYNENSRSDEREYPIKVMRIVERYIKTKHLDYQILVNQKQERGYIHIYTSWNFAPYNQ